ncbi:MAG TPA: polysaccharide deacetylase family protein [Streptosporangiaceae bacterium]
MLIAAIAGSVAAMAACGGTGAPPPGSHRSASPSGTAEPAPFSSRASPGPRPVAGWLAGRDWTYLPTGRHVVALTFDAGANADAVPSILATLRRDRVAATFFLTGAFARAYPAAARAIAARGFLIGNHTITHPYLTRLSDQEVRAEILGAARDIRAVTGDKPAPLFRFPYGDADARTIGIVNRLGYVPVRWTVDTLGWKGTAGGISASKVLTRILDALRPGEIVLMHVGSNPNDHSTLDADALPMVISELRARGYSFVTLGALTG